MAVSLEAELPFIGCPVRISLGLCLQHQIILLLQRSGHIPSEGDLRPGEVILAWMVNIHACHSQGLCRMEMIHIRLHPVGIAPPLEVEIVGDKLIFSLILLYNLCLPFQIFVYKASLKFFKLCPQASIDSSSHIREVFPGVNPVAPVVKAELPVHLVQVSLKLFSQIFDKFLLDVLPCRSIIFRLIIQLEPNDTFSVSRMLHQLPDHPLPIVPVNRMGDIHNLSGAINAPPLHGSSQHIRMRFHHPGRNRIGGRADDYVDLGFFHGIHHPLHMRKVKNPFLRLAGTPGGFRDSYRIDPGFFHHFHIFI